MILKRGLFLAAILALSIQFGASAQTPDASPAPAAPAPAETAATAEITAATQAAPAAAEQTAPAQPVAPVTAPAPAEQPAPAETQPQTSTPAPAPAEQPVTPAEQPATGTTAVEAQPPAPASNTQSVSAKDFILKQEELSYGVTLISKAVKMRIPFESNPILIENKDQIKTIAGRMFIEVKELPDNLNAMAINLMSYKKDDKDHDFGLIALELKESSRADAEVFKGLIKTSMMSYFKEETFFIADKFPLIVIIAHNYPEGKKEDIKWAFDLAQKKFEK
jgi:hypothetical protein